jgi:hypothetical protein
MTLGARTPTYLKAVCQSEIGSVGVKDIRHGMAEIGEAKKSGAAIRLSS